MILQLGLPFKLKAGEEDQFLTSEELYELNARRAEAFLAIPKDERVDFIVANILADVRRAYVDEVSEGVGREMFARRVANKLLRMAVDYRYTDKESGRVSIPRRESDKRKPAVWWGDIVGGSPEDAASPARLSAVSGPGLDDYPEELSLSVEAAIWLVKVVWFDDRAQNGFAPNMQAWVNVMDREMSRLLDEIEDAQTRLAPKPAKVAPIVKRVSPDGALTVDEDANSLSEGAITP